jgi:uncharacterized LabA/DUF88 family protein
MTKAKSEETWVFIDAENARNSLESMGYSGFDYEKLYKWLTEKKGVSRIYLYVALENGDTAKAEKYRALEELGYYVSTKKVMIYAQKPMPIAVECPDCGKEFIHKAQRRSKPKANCDVELTLDVMNNGVRGRYKNIIVFSGDGDFGDLYKYVATQLDGGNKTVTVYSPMRMPAALRTSSVLKNLAKKGTINLFPLEVVAQYYALK